MLQELLPEPEVQGLLELMLLYESRRATRSGVDGEVILLEAQDRSVWGRELIAEGGALVLQALHSRRFGPYSLQAAIASVHAEAASLEDTDWVQIVGLYDELLRLNPSLVIELNRAVALAMRDGLETGLQQIDRLLAMGELDGYHLAHAARADLLRRLGRREQAIAAYRQALALAQQGPDRQFLQRRLEELGDTRVRCMHRDSSVHTLGAHGAPYGAGVLSPPPIRESLPGAGQPCRTSPGSVRAARAGR